MTDRRQYLDEQIANKLQYWIRAMLLLGILFFPFIGIADYFVTPENFRRFAVYRIIITLVLIVAYYLNGRRKSTRYQYTLIAAATILAAIPIELMILSFGGHASSYYAGFSLLIIAAIGLIPYGFRLSLAMGIIVYLIYVVPILIFDTVTDVSRFVANNIFMICTFIIALTWRTLTQRTMINELNLQYDLLTEKNALKQYSEQLEHAMKDLNRSEQWHQSLFENATDGIIVLDRNGVIKNVNQRACEMHGFSREALIGAPLRLLEADGDREQTSERMRRIMAGESLVFESVHTRKDRGSIHLEVSSKAITVGDELFIQSFYRDITEKKKIQEHLFQSQKLESIGVLAGGVAHDFNNVLTAILGYTELIRRQSEENENVIRSLNVIESAARKSGRMISQLLDFSRKKTREVVPFSLNDVVSDTVRLLERVIDKKISFNKLLDGSLPLIRGDVNLMEQVLMNLIVNARDAMPGGGRIMISTGTVESRKGSSKAPPYVPEGRYVLLQIADTGTGIPPEIQDKIFEPFFTTKERGKGTGLGLSMAYGVIKEHDGFITVQSALHRGTTFSIYLPAVEALAASLEQQPAAPAAPMGRETILVVDDEEAVLNFVKEALEIYGYRVLAVNDPLRAFEIFEHDHRKIDLVITDVAMPTMSGKDLIQRIRTIDPSARVLEMSAFGNIVDLSGKSAPDGFVQKPFEAFSLATTIRKLLDKGPGTVLFN